MSDRSRSTVRAEQRQGQEWLLSRWQRAVRASTLPRTDRLVALTLASFMNPEGWAKPGLETLARGAGLSMSALAKSLQRLDGKWIIRTPGGGRRPGGEGITTRYQATIPETLLPLVESSAENSLPKGRELSPPGAGTLSPGVERNRSEHKNTGGTSAELAPSGGSASRAEPEPPYSRSPWSLEGIPFGEFMRLPREERETIIGRHSAAEMAAIVHQELDGQPTGDEQPDPFDVLDHAFHDEAAG